jgi:hypothetical protein
VSGGPGAPEDTDDLRTRGPAPIAYLGASVTVQRRSGYRTPLHANLCRISGRPHLPVLAGVGGVGSISGLFLLDDLVLRHRPGLCFIEFATTDMVGLTPPDVLRPVLEALVCRLRAHGCEPCFLLLGRRDAIASDRDSVLAAYRNVAEVHDVVCVDLTERLEQTPGMFRDVVHTTDAGAELVAAGVASAIGEALPALQSPRATRWAPSFMRTRLERVRLEQLSDPGEGTQGVLGDLFDYVRARPGNEFVATFGEELVGLVLGIGPSAGTVRVSAGGHVEQALTWDFMCHYERLTTLILEKPCPAGETIRIEAVQEEIDYSLAHVEVEDPALVEQDLRLIG